MTEANFRTAGIEDIRTMLDWARCEGWNPGLDDAETFLAADPGGFFVAEIGGLPVASISVVNHSADFAFLGLYICRSGFRGQGIGLSLWRHALAHAGDRVIGLDGVAAQQGNYARSGFVRTGATVRFEGSVSPIASGSIRPAQVGDGAAIRRLDELANGYSRQPFLAAWSSDTAERRTMVLVVGSEVVGFATIRRCIEGAKIGPIVAPDPDMGLALTRAAVASLPSERVIVDVPQGSPGFADHLRQLGFVETFATARMYRGEPPRHSGILQAIATMELG